MDITKTYISKDKKYSFINFETNYRAEEEYGLVNLYKSIDNGYFSLELKEIEYNRKIIPILLINKEYIEKKEINILQDYNNSEPYNKLCFNKSNYNEFIKSIKKGNLEELFVGFKANGEIYEHNPRFISSFYSGKTLIIFPNMFYSYLPLEYFEKTGGFDYKLKEEYKDNLLEEYKTNAKNEFIKNCSFIYSVYNSFINNGVLKFSNNTMFSNGGCLLFPPKNIIDFTNKNSVFPLEYIDGRFIRKEKEKLEKEVKEKKNYIKEHKKAMKRLEKVKKKLDKKGLNYFALKTAKKVDNTWFYYLNPVEQNLYNSGWVTIKDLKDWTKNTGKIVI